MMRKCSISREINLFIQIIFFKYFEQELCIIVGGRKSKTKHNYEKYQKMGNHKALWYPFRSGIEKKIQPEIVV